MAATNRNLGRYDTPHGFPKVKKRLCFYYEANSTSWMTTAFFAKYLSDWNKDLAKQNRNVLVFIDNCPAHPQNMRFSNITVKFLPKNTTSVLQPMDMGVIRSFKAFYRRQIVQRIVQELVEENACSADDVKITLWQALKYMKIAWDTVTPTTIKNCFRKAGFNIEQCDGDQDCDNDFNLLPKDLTAGISFDDFVNCDDDLNICNIPSPSTSTASSSTLEEPEVTEVEQLEIGDDDDDFQETLPPTFNDVMTAIKTIEASADLDMEKNVKLLYALDIFRSSVVRDKVASKVQSKITDFFAKKV